MARRRPRRRFRRHRRGRRGPRRCDGAGDERRLDRHRFRQDCGMLRRGLGRPRPLGRKRRRHRTRPQRAGQNLCRDDRCRTAHRGRGRHDHAFGEGTLLRQGHGQSRHVRQRRHRADHGHSGHERSHAGSLINRQRSFAGLGPIRRHGAACCRRIERPHGAQLRRREKSGLDSLMGAPGEKHCEKDRPCCLRPCPTLHYWQSCHRELVSRTLISKDYIQSSFRFG
jgi:hypothetical protein